MKRLLPLLKIAAVVSSVTLAGIYIWLWKPVADTAPAPFDQAGKELESKKDSMPTSPSASAQGESRSDTPVLADSLSRPPFTGTAGSKVFFIDGHGVWKKPPERDELQPLIRFLHDSSAWIVHWWNRADEPATNDIPFSTGTQSIQPWTPPANY